MNSAELRPILEAALTEPIGVAVRATNDLRVAYIRKLLNEARNLDETYSSLVICSAPERADELFIVNIDKLYFPNGSTNG